MEYSIVFTTKCCDVSCLALCSAFINMINSTGDIVGKELITLPEYMKLGLQPNMTFIS